jgi:hypothetical protein
MSREEVRYGKGAPEVGSVYQKAPSAHITVLTTCVRELSTWALSGGAGIEGA